MALNVNVFSRIALSKEESVSRLESLASQKSDYSQKRGYNTLGWDGQKW